jgi:hypothetical protein
VRSCIFSFDLVAMMARQLLLTARARLGTNDVSTTFAFAIFAAIVAVVNIEVVLRSEGYRPTVADTPILWAYHRREVDRSGESGVALIGTSRMMIGFSTDAFHRRFPALRASQLALQGSSPMTVLQDLARDPDFRGTVICEFPEALWIAGPEYFKHEYLDFSHQEASWKTDMTVRIDGFLRERFCCRNPELGLDKVVAGWVQKRTWPTREYGPIRFDRHQIADYRDHPRVAERARATTVLRMQALLKRLEPSIPNPDAWLKGVLAIEPDLARIRSKGGQAVFVRFPSTDETWLLEERSYPKKRYWDRFAAATSGIPIHFLDVPALARTDCPDTSHIDARDADDFTNNLLNEIVARGALRDGIRAAP